MGLLDMFLPRVDIDFAHSLAEKISRQFPPASENKLAKKGGQRRLEAILQTVMDDITVFQRQHSLGWFRKARLGNSFRWRLTDLGYSEGFVKALTDGLIHHIAIKH